MGRLDCRRRLLLDRRCLLLLRLPAALGTDVAARKDAAALGVETPVGHGERQEEERHGAEGDADARVVEREEGPLRPLVNVGGDVTVHRRLRVRQAPVCPEERVADLVDGCGGFVGAFCRLGGGALLAVAVLQNLALVSLTKAVLTVFSLT